MLELLEVTNPAIKKKREKEKEEAARIKQDESANKLYEKLIAEEENELFEDRLSRIEDELKGNGPEKVSKRARQGEQSTSKRPRSSRADDSTTKNSGDSASWIIDNEGKRRRSNKRSLLKPAAKAMGEELLANEEEELRLLESIAFKRDGDVLEKLDKQLDDLPNTEPTTKVTVIREGKHGLEEIDTDEIEKAAWVDPDDDRPVVSVIRDERKIPRGALDTDTYKEALEKKFNQLHAAPKWVQNALKKNKAKKQQSQSDSEEDEASSDDDIELNQIAGERRAKTKGLPVDYLPNRRCYPLDFHKPKTVPIIKAQFNPKIKVSMTASPNGWVNFYQVDGKDNKHTQSVNFRGFEISDAQFTPDGGDIIVGSDKISGHFFTYDLMEGKIVKRLFQRSPKDRFSLGKFALSPDGKFMAAIAPHGFIRIVSAGPVKEILYELKRNAQCSDLKFNPDSSQLYAHGNDGSVYIWDMRQQKKCLNRFYDEGCVQGTAIDISPDGQFLATGSEAGIVNIYETHAVQSTQTPTPYKVVDNLVTYIHGVRFNPTSQILSLWSTDKSNAMRLVHLPTGNVYQNFPPPEQDFESIVATDFSPRSSFITIANQEGKAHLYRLLPYKGY